MMKPGGYYRRGRKATVIDGIANASQTNSTVDYLREALKAESLMKKPRRWLFTALRARIEELSKRVDKLDEIAVLKLLPPMTAAKALEYVPYATRWLNLYADCNRAVPVSRGAAEAYLTALPPGKKLVAYSACGCLFYFGELPERVSQDKN